jgi:hypothetical protein
MSDKEIRSTVYMLLSPAGNIHNWTQHLDRMIKWGEIEWQNQLEMRRKERCRQTKIEMELKFGTG